MRVSIWVPETAIRALAPVAILFKACLQSARLLPT